MPDQHQQLVSRVQALAERTDRSTSTLSRILFGSGTRIDEIKNGGSLSLAVYERVISKLAELERAA